MRGLGAGTVWQYADHGVDANGRTDFVGAALAGGSRWQFPYTVESRTTLGEPVAVDRGRGSRHNLRTWRAFDPAGNLRHDWLYTDAAGWQAQLLATDATDYDAIDRLAQYDAQVFGPTRGPWGRRCGIR